MGLLNSKGRFGIPACASAFFNVSSLAIGIGGYYVCPLVDIHPVTGMAFGVIVGGILQFLIQVPSMSRVGFRYRPMLNLRDPRVRQVLHLIGPAVLGVAAVQVNLLTNTFFITSDSGWLTWISRAYRVMHLPIGIFGVAISTVALPQLARLATAGETRKFPQSDLLCTPINACPDNSSCNWTHGVVRTDLPFTLRMGCNRRRRHERNGGDPLHLYVRAVWVFRTQDRYRWILRLQRHPRPRYC